jgi:hypothetical protein
LNRWFLRAIDAVYIDATIEKRMETDTPLHVNDDDVHSIESQTDEESDSITCPLFLDGLPKNFSQNAALAALASLLDDETTDKPNQDVKCVSSFSTSASSVENVASGGGKVRKEKSGRRSRQNQNNPYPRPIKKASKLSVTETSLFLKLWKLK